MFVPTDEVRGSSATPLAHRACGFRGLGLEVLEDRWADPRKREDLLSVARALERQSAIVGLCAHLLAVATKP